MKAAGKAGMTEDQVADFVSRYMPAYEAYLPNLYKEGPSSARRGRNLTIEVDQSRSPVKDQPSPKM
jgi:D-glycerate 3-kinase